MKRLVAAKLERLGRLVCGPLWQSELARTMGVSRQTVLRWAADRAAGWATRRTERPRFSCSQGNCTELVTLVVSHRASDC